MVGKNYNEGSLWRRWDLHLHTPETKKEDNYTGATPEEKWSNYAATINAHTENISVVGVTDYLCTNNYFKFKKLIEDDVISKTFDLIIPNVELRISPVTNNSTPINIHCLFNPAFENKIQNRFFENISVELLGRKYKPTKNELIELGRNYKNDQSYPEGAAWIEGIKQYVIPFSTLKKLFDEDSELRQNAIIIAANGSGDGVSGLKHYELLEGEKYSSLESTRQSIYQFTDAIFSSNEGDYKYFLGKKTDADGNIVDDENEVKRKCGSLKPCFHGCDAHDNAKVFVPTSNLFCWVKADPTFEGLKQVIFEPAERVKIRESNPTSDFDKPIFSSIEIQEELKLLNDENSNLHFEKCALPINRNLVSIIGGRGQGKSMLVNYIGHGTNKVVASKLKEKLNLDDKYVIEWKQGEASLSKKYPLGTPVSLPFTFIHQSKVKELADDNELLKREIIDMLNGAGLEKPNKTVDEFEIKENFQKYWNIREWLERQDVEGEQIHNQDNINKQIEAVQANINLATEGSNKELLEKYVGNIKQIESKKEEQLTLRGIRKKLLEFKEVLNTELEPFPSITKINVNQQLGEIISIYRNNLRSIIALQTENKKIKDENFTDFKGDLVQLLNNLENYQHEITELQKLLKQVEQNQIELQEQKQKINGIIQYHKKYLLDEATAITNVWEKKIFDNPERGSSENEIIQKILAGRNIKIEGTIFFNTNQFFASVEKFIDGRAVKPKTKQKIFELLQVSLTDSSNDVLNYTYEKLEEIKKENPSCFYEGMENDLLKVLIYPEHRDKYVYVFPNITVGAKTLNELSAGQKGTVYLCLKLATQLFSGPIIFDQPEDDLDNDFITNELVSLFKEIKKYRQVIIVSHNANLVVNSDSEQVIIANNTDERLSYEAGSLENEEINKEICRILEGGERAFEKRRNKYRYVK